MSLVSSIARRTFSSKTLPLLLSVLVLASCGGGNDGTLENTVQPAVNGRQASPPATDGSVSAKAMQLGSMASVMPDNAPIGASHDYIVVFRSDVGNPAEEARRLTDGKEAKIRFIYTSALKGFAVTLPEAAAQPFLMAAERHPLIDHVEVDQPVLISQTTQANAAWGLDRTDQRDLPLSTSYTYSSDGAGVLAYIIDTGIISGHTDFGGRVISGYDGINDGYGTSDCNGHGTHVAGTVGSATWGIAKRVSLVPVRVLSCDGSGSMSGVLAGLDWVATNAVRPAVVNMSIWGGSSASVDSAVANITAKDITVVVAAGNNAGDACNYSPARESSAITVGATANTDVRASYSNFGTCLDLFAPGSSITSTWYTSMAATNTLSGTSMAAPHVAGLAAQILQSAPGAMVVDIVNAIKSAATSGKVIDAGTGSPNLLSYTGTAGGGAPPTTEIVVSVKLLTGTSATVRSGWQATTTISVKDSNGAAIPSAVVSGGFSVGGSSLNCTTASTGICKIVSGNLSKATSDVKFSVTNIAGSGIRYDARQNVASSIMIKRP